MRRSLSHKLPGHISFGAAEFRARILDVLDNYVPARDFLTTLGRAHGVVLGSVAHHVASVKEIGLPMGLDVAVNFEGFDAMFPFLDGQGYVPPPILSISSATKGKDDLAPDYLVTSTTAEMTYLTPSSWVTLYPLLWQARVSWFRWNDKVTQYIRDKQYSLRNSGFKVVSTNASYTGTCVSCPASVRVLPGNEDIYVMTHTLARRRNDVHGLNADRMFLDSAVKWRFSVHCFNTNCNRYLPNAVRQPAIFFAPSSEETVACNTDEYCNFKINWISSLYVNTFQAILLRPNHAPNLVPVYVEPTLTRYHTIDSLSVELWFARTGGEVWSLKDHRLHRTDVEENTPGLSYTLYVSPRDSVDFKRFHECEMVLVKHTTDAPLSFTTKDLLGIKRYIYEWLDPSLVESDSEAGCSDYYADPEEA
ncbi:hypothetical protein K435DRAFT_808461 [Dendrothele bispora CBS 962.96]|uniref:Uncharacterized protein n=1 Tax=Dendrothele bispora (strain CBS 962.96) TaxID=1314807 RepID=A0A4S8L1G3_DENBC|nr:hypothetical protein K435DRAFT_808461 [Dendrothele bispora CBS 962.96]